MATLDPNPNDTPPARHRSQTPGVGSLRWAERTSGVLSARDRLRLLGQGLLMQAEEVPHQLRGRLGFPFRRRAFADPDCLRPPDSQVAKEAEELCRQMRPRMLVNHSFRTYLWASILGAYRGMRYDEEAVYVGALLHDYGLAEGHSDPPACFTLLGAGAAKQIGQHCGWEPRRSDLAAEAITLHMNLRVSKDAPEAYLVAAGTQLDVIGRGFWHVHPDTIAAVLERYPRGEVKREMLTLFREQSKRHPGTRARLYQRYLGLPLLIRSAPFKG